MADQHPTHAEPEPPFPEQEQEPPGREADMQPLADHGQEVGAQVGVKAAF